MLFFRKKSYSVEKYFYSNQPRLSIFEKNVVLLQNSDYQRETSCDTFHYKKQDAYLGLLCIVATSVLFTLISVIVKKLSYLHTGHLVLARNAGIFVGCLPIIVYRAEKCTTSKEDIASLLSRSTVGVIAVYLNILAFKNLPLDEAAVIMAATPVMTIVFARIYLKEHCTRVEIWGLVLTFFGVLFLLDLPDVIFTQSQCKFSFSYFWGVICAVGCVFARCALYVVLRSVRDMHFSVALMYFSLFGFIENAVIAFYTTTFEYPDCGWDSVLIMSIGIIAFIGHWILALAIKLVQDGLVAIIKSCFDILIAIMFGITFFNDDTDLYTIIGACLVTFPLIMTGFNVWLLTLPDSSKTKNRFQMFLT